MSIMEMLLYTSLLRKSYKIEHCWSWLKSRIRKRLKNDNHHTDQLHDTINAVLVEVAVQRVGCTG